MIIGMIPSLSGHFFVFRFSLEAKPGLSDAETLNGREISGHAVFAEKS
jgi:hypothetical protein